MLSLSQQLMTVTDQDSDSGCADVSTAGSHDEVADDVAVDDAEGGKKTRAIEGDCESESKYML